MITWRHGSFCRRFMASPSRSKSTIEVSVSLRNFMALPTARGAPSKPARSSRLTSLVRMTR